MSNVLEVRQLAQYVPPEVALIHLVEAEEATINEAEALARVQSRCQNIRLLAGSIAVTAVAFLCSPDDTLAQSARDALRPVAHVFGDVLGSMGEFFTEGS